MKSVFVFSEKWAAGDGRVWSRAAQLHGLLRLLDHSHLCQVFVRIMMMVMIMMMILARIVDMLDQINNHGKPMEDYTFWPDVLDGLKGGRAFYMLK